MYLTKIARKILQRDEAILAASGPLDAITPSNGAWWVVKERDGSGNLVDQTGGGRNLTLPGGSANPVLLDHDGTNDYFWFPGTNGNCLTTPNAAPLQITGDADLQAFVRLDDWTPASAASIHGKYDAASGTACYRIAVSISGDIVFDWFDSGGVVRNAVSTVATGLANGAEQWIRATIDVDNGAGDAEIKFYLGGSDPSAPSWSQLGSTVLFGATTDIRAGSSQYVIGAQRSTWVSINGRIYRAITKDGIDGTTVLDVNAADADPDATTFTESSANAATVTINRSSTGYKTAVVDQPCYAAATDDYLQSAGSALFQVGASEDFTAVFVGRFHHDAALERYMSTFGIGTGFYIQNVSGNVRGLIDDGPSTASVGAGATLTNTAVAKNALRNTSGSTLQTYANGSTQSVADGTTGAIGTATPAMTLFAADGANFADCELIGAAFIKGTAWTDAEISDIADALITANGGTP